MAGLADHRLAQRLASLEAAAPAEAATLAEIAALRASAVRPAETGEALSGMHRATKVTEALRAELLAGAADRAAETLTARLDGPRDRPPRDPEAEIAGLAGRLDGMKQIRRARPAGRPRSFRRAARRPEGQPVRRHRGADRVGRLEGELPTCSPASASGSRPCRRAWRRSTSSPAESPFGEIAEPAAPPRPRRMPPWRRCSRGSAPLEMSRCGGGAAEATDGPPRPRPRSRRA